MQLFHQTFKIYLLKNLSYYQLYVQISKQNIFEVVHLMLKILCDFNFMDKKVRAGSDRDLLRYNKLFFS